MMQLVASSLDVDDPCAFKRSASKKSWMLGAVPTNLMLHSTTVAAASFAPPPPSPSFAPASAAAAGAAAAEAFPRQSLRLARLSDATDDTRDGGSVCGSIDGSVGGSCIGYARRDVHVSTVTFGCPAAHSLGFREGGLHEGFARLSAAVGFFKQRGAKNRRSADVCYQLLACRAAVQARECLCVGQALAAAAAACAAHLGQAVRARDGPLLAQLGAVGVLLHSAALLSTTGNEAAMIDDFRGAYERLRLTLCIEAASGSGNGSGNGPGLANGSSSLRVLRVEPTNSSASDGVGGSADDDDDDDLEAGEGEGGYSSYTKFAGSRERECGLGAVTVTLAAEPADFAWIVGILGPKPTIKVIPVLFNLGIRFFHA